MQPTLVLRAIPYMASNTGEPFGKTRKFSALRRPSLPARLSCGHSQQSKSPSRACVLSPFYCDELPRPQTPPSSGTDTPSLRSIRRGGCKMALIRAIAQPHGAGSVGAEIQKALNDARWNTFRCAVAFAKSSGVRHIAKPLRSFASRKGTTTRLSIGISSQGTSLEGLQDLWRLVSGLGDLYVFHEGSGLQTSFHPKAFLFRNESEAMVVVGSSNLTEGGLFVNHEISSVVELTLTKGSADAKYLSEIESALDGWQTPGATCLAVDPSLLKGLHEQGDLPSEAALSVIRKQSRAALRKGSAAPSTAAPKIKFGSSGVPKAPPPQAFPSGILAAPVKPTIPSPASGVVPPILSLGATGLGSAPSPVPAGTKCLYMEVRPHHNGEVFLSYRAIDDDPIFFGHPFSGWTTPRAKGAKPYPMATPDPIVDIVVYDVAGNVVQAKSSHPLNMVDYELKHEIRITMPDRLQDLIPAMSLLVMTKDPTPTLDYLLEFHPPGSPLAATLAPKLTVTLPAGGAGVGRKYGWS